MKCTYRAVYKFTFNFFALPYTAPSNRRGLALSFPLGIPYDDVRYSNPPWQSVTLSSPIS